LALHGGHLDIASRLGEGTRVAIRLPLDCEAARKRGEPPAIGRLAARVSGDMPDERMKISA
jgi:hypothetical protein